MIVITTNQEILLETVAKLLGAVPLVSSGPGPACSVGFLLDGDDELAADALRCLGLHVTVVDGAEPPRESQDSRGVRFPESPYGLPSGLTVRDRRVISLVLEGRGNKQIASELRMSDAAVKRSMQKIFEKFGVRNRSQVVRLALQEGFPKESAQMSRG